MGDRRISLNLEPFHRVQRVMLEQGNSKEFIDRLNEMPSAKPLFKTNLAFGMSKASTCLDVLIALKEAEEALKKGNNLHVEKHFKNACAINAQFYEHYDKIEKCNKVQRIVFGKMEELLGNLDIQDLGMRVFTSPTSDSELKLKALQAGTKHYENHWSGKLLTILEKNQSVFSSPSQCSLVTHPSASAASNLSSVDSQKSSTQPFNFSAALGLGQAKALASSSSSKSAWESQYEKLKSRIAARRIHPVEEDNPDIVNLFADDFIIFFDQIPDKQKAEILRTPLYPNCHFPEGTLPVDYILLTGNLESLKKIADYLEEKDWEAEKLLNTTYCNCILHGILETFPTFVLNLMSA